MQFFKLIHGDNWLSVVHAVFKLIHGDNGTVNQFKKLHCT